MWEYGLKVALTTVVVVAVSEIGKRSTFWAAILASLPLTSLLAFAWLYVETGDSERVAALSQSVFWLVIPSLLLLVLLPLLLRAGWSFWPSFALGCAATAGAYVVMVRVLSALDVRL